MEIVIAEALKEFRNVERTCRKTGSNTSHSRSTLAKFQDNGEYTFGERDPLTFLHFLLVWSRCKGESRTTCFNPSLTAIQNHSRVAGWLFVHSQDEV